MSIRIHPGKSSLSESLIDSSEDGCYTYDEAINMAGSSNFYQIRVAFLIAIGMAIGGIQVMSFPFIFQQTKVECMGPDGEWTECVPNENTCQLPMRPQPGSPNTVPVSYGLLCGGDTYRIIIETTYMIASALGIVLIAPIADKYGKRKTLLLSYLITCFSLLGYPLSPNWILLVTFNIFSGLGRAPFINYGYQLLVEISNEKFRAIGVLIMGVSFALGAAGAGVLNAWVDSDWQHFYLFFLALPCLLALPLVYFWSDESPLSYFPSRQYDKAREVLQRIAAINKKTLPSVIIFSEESSYYEVNLSKASTDDIETKEVQKYSYLDLFKYRSLRRAALGGSYVCFVTYFVFYGQMLAIDSLSNNPVLVSVLTSIVEAIACIASTKFLTKLARRSLLMISFGIVAIAFAIFGVISFFDTCDPNDKTCLEVYTYIGYAELSLGRFWIALLMCTTFVYSNELFPTVIRSRGAGFVNFFGRVGSIIPSTVIYACKEAEISPALVFGILALPAIIVSWCLDETKGRPLLNHIQEEEEANQIKSFETSCDDDMLI